MLKYVKENPRISVQYVDAETDEVLFEIPSKNWMNVGEVFTDYHAVQVINDHYKKIKDEHPSKSIIVLASAEFNLVE